ncbi:MAG: hypothetical protein RLZZ324_1177 [Candidatus Parcubacteria bacterium]
MARKRPVAAARPPSGIIAMAMAGFERVADVLFDPIVDFLIPPLRAHWEKKYRTPWPEKYAHRMLILDFTLGTIIAMLIVAGIFFNFVLPKPRVSGSIGVQAVAPGEMVSGADTEYDIAYHNDSSKPLDCATLTLDVPEGTVVTGAPTATQGAGCATPTVAAPQGAADGSVIITIPLGTIAPGTHDSVRVKARTYGPTGSQKTLISELAYWPEGATQPLRYRDTRSWTVTRSGLVITASAPKNLLRGRQLTATFALRNASSSPIGPLTLRLTKPDDFAVSGLVPDAGAGGAWSVPVLAPGAATSVKVVGAFRGPDGGAAPVLALGAYVREGDKDLLLEEARPNLDPKATGFTLTHSLSAQVIRGGFQPGEHVQAQVRYENRGTTALHDVHVSLYADGRLITEATPAELTWDKSNAPELAVLQPGANGTFSATFTVRADAGATAAKPAPKADAALTGSPIVTAPEPAMLETYAIASFSLADDPDNAVKVSSTPITLPIATRLGVEAAAFYYTREGDQLGIGPLPPREGQTTKYRVVLNVTNSSGDAQGVTLEATLPPDVAWTGKYSVASGQALDYLPISGKIRWDIGTIAARAGAEDSGTGASFEVALTPGKDAVGDATPLLTGIRVTGKDVTTGLTLYGSAPAITTDLPFDARAAGKSAVVAAKK